MRPVSFPDRLAMSRRKKLIIVSALLLAGAGAALVFRKPDEPGKPDDAASQTKVATESASSIDAEAVPRLDDDDSEPAESGNRLATGGPANGSGSKTDGTGRAKIGNGRPAKAVLTDSSSSGLAQDAEATSDEATPADQQQADVSRATSTSPG